MEENVNVSNDTQEPVVEVQEPVTDEATESVQPEEVADSEVTAEQEPKKKQSREENAEFKKVRQKATQDAEDKLIDRMYGKSHDIHTIAEYDAAMAKQRQTELANKAKDSDDPMQFIEQMKHEWEANDPRLKEYETMKTDMAVNRELKQLNADLKDMGLDAIEDIAAIATLPSGDKVNEYITKGMSLAEAYFLANKNDIIKAEAEKVQQDTIKKIKANDGGPGSLADTGATATLYTREQVDAMSQAQVNKHYDLIMKSMKSW